MDKMPFKSNTHSRKEDDQTVADSSESGPAVRPVRITPKPVTSTETVLVQDTKRSVGIVAAVVALYIVVILLSAAYFLIPKGESAVLPAVDTNKYQAVTLANGDIYIGKMSFEGGDYVKLQDVFYLSPILASEQTSSADEAIAKQNFNLNKFTEIAYNPDDEMTIPRSQITHFENLKSGGKVAQLISQYKKKN